MPEVISKTKSLIIKHGKEQSALIPLLQNVQTEYGYVPKESIDLIADELFNIPCRNLWCSDFLQSISFKSSGKAYYQSLSRNRMSCDGWKSNIG